MTVSNALAVLCSFAGLMVMRINVRLANYSNSSYPKHKECDRLDWSTTVLFLLTYMNDTQSALSPDCQSVE